MQRYGTVIHCICEPLMSGLQFCAQEEMKGMKESNQKEFQESEVGKLMKCFVCAFCLVRFDFKKG